ncbi:uncharacterized protein LOC144677686 [Cetorhinus maximus]
MAAEDRSSPAGGQGDGTGPEDEQDARPEETDRQPLQANGRAEGPRALVGGGDEEPGHRHEGARDKTLLLAASSVICGCSCVGIYAVVNAVRASECRKRGDLEAAGKYTNVAIKSSGVSFAVCVLSILLALGFVVLLSYLIRIAR